MADAVKPVAERQLNPVVQAKDVPEIIAAVRSADPKLVVFLGKHEPSEPTARLVEAKVEGKPLHEHYKPGEVLFVRLPDSHTPYGFRKRHAAFLESLAGEIEGGKAHITPNPVVDRAFAKAVREALSGGRTDLPDMFAENLLAMGMTRERIFMEVNTARDVVHNIAIAQGLVPPTEEMACKEVGKAVGRKVNVVSLHYTNGFVPITSGKEYEERINEVAPGYYSYLQVEFGGGGMRREELALSQRERSAIQMSANWEEAPERMFPECVREDEYGQHETTSQVGSKQFYLERVGEVELARFEAGARDLKGLLDQLIGR